MLHDGLRLARVSRIFLTHSHGDHAYGLPGLLCTRAGAFDGETIPSPLMVVGPPGTREFIRATLRFSEAHLSYHYVVHELHRDAASCAQHASTATPLWSTEMPGRDVLPDADGLWTVPDSTDGSPNTFSVRAGPLEHRVPCIGFVLVEPDMPGSLDPSRVVPLLQAQKAALEAQGVRQPLSLLGQLKAGKELVLPDGTRIRPEDCIGPARPGRKLVILGDTSDPWSLRDAAADCDVLVHESTNANVAPADDKPAETTDEQVEAMAISRGHSTPQMAGRFAAAVRAKALALNHFSQRYVDDPDNPKHEAVMEAIANLARRHFEGEVITARDHMELPVLRRT